LITTEVYVTGPNYRHVEVDVSVIADPSQPLGVVEAAVSNKLLANFNPVTGQDFGSVISQTGTLGLVLTTPGVVRLGPTGLTIRVDGVKYTQDLTLGASEIAYSDVHQVGVSYS
jgi:hypothetical protein